MESGRDWSTDEDDPTDNPEPGSSLSKKSSSRKRKAGRLVKSRISKSSKLKRNYESNESGPSWNGTNTRTLITAITKNKDIVHDFKKIIDSKITGKPVHVEELKSVAEPVGTRSTVQVENVVEGRIATRPKKPKNSQKSAAPHFGKNITTFAKADLPSDDEEDVEFNISSDKHEEEEEEEDEDEDEEEDFSEVDDIPVLQDEDTRTSIRSEDSVQIIARKTRSKAPIPDPIEKIVDKFKPPDDFDDALLEDAQIRNSEGATQDTWAYQSFLYETFVQTTVNDMEAEHTEDDDDDDFNPNEFIDDLLDLNKDEIGNGIISKREARELQYDAYDMLFPQPTIDLTPVEPDSESRTCLQGNVESYEIMESNQNDIDYYDVIEEARGFNTDTYTKLISQMHMYTQARLQTNVVF